VAGPARAGRGLVAPFVAPTRARRAHDAKRLSGFVVQVMDTLPDAPGNPTLP
jgi:hypothetical protein